MVALLTPQRRPLIFLAIFVLLFVYLYQGLRNVPYFYWDENLYTNAARAYLTTEKP